MHATVVKKAVLKRSYQQTKQEPEDPVIPPAQATNMDFDINGEPNGDGSDRPDKATGGHNAVEQKYRRGINDSLIMLREIVPALQHLRAAPGTAPSKRKMSQFSLAAAATPAAPSGIVDGVMAPNKLSKQLILVTATDYIRYLINRREELEGELEMLKTTLHDCVDDSAIVMNLFEQRWAPERARLVQEREQMQQERMYSKGSGKKKPKLESDEAGNSGMKKDRGKKDEMDSESEESDEDDDDDLPNAISSALPTKGQPRARNNIKKSSKNSVAGFAPSAGASQASAPRQHMSSSGPPKALMSVFAGVSFAGGAGYDILYGASSTNAGAAGQSEAVNPARVWSHGLIRRSDPSSSLLMADSPMRLSYLQTFFLERPALLSGLSMLLLSGFVSYIVLYLLPSTYRHYTRSSRIARKQQARATLVNAAQHPAESSTALERHALAVLAASPSSSGAQILRMPALLASAAWTWMFARRTGFATDPAALERAASALRLLELDMASGTLATLIVITMITRLNFMLLPPLLLQ